MAGHFSFSPKNIPDPFSFSTSVAKSIVAGRVYRGCVVSVFHRATMVGLIKLDIVDFDVILKMN